MIQGGFVIEQKMGAQFLRVFLVVGMALAATQLWATPPAAEVSPTLMVDRSAEPIGHPYLDWDRLPKTLSVDPLTDQEIRKLKIELYRGSSNCVAWYYIKRHGQLEVIGIQANGLSGTGLIKLNGRLRPAIWGGDAQVGRFDPMPGLGAAEIAVLHIDTGCPLDLSAPRENAANAPIHGLHVHEGPLPALRGACGSVMEVLGDGHSN